MGTPILQFYRLDPGEKYAYLSLDSSHPVRDCITCHVLRGTRFKRWIGKRNPAFQVSLRRSWIESKRSFLVAQKEDSRSRSPNFLFRVEERRERGEREREKRNTKGTTLPRARIALSRTSWIARKETVLSRRKVLFVCASPLNQLFLQKNLPISNFAKTNKQKSINESTKIKPDSFEYSSNRKIFFSVKKKNLLIVEMQRERSRFKGSAPNPRNLVSRNFFSTLQIFLLNFSRSLERGISANRAQAVRTVSEWESERPTVRWTSAVKVSIIPLALPYFSYGKLCRVVS